MSKVLILLQLGRFARDEFLRWRKENSGPLSDEILAKRAKEFKRALDKAKQQGMNSDEAIEFARSVTGMA